LSHLPKQPRARGVPVAFDRAWRDRHHLRRLVDGQATEESQLDDAGAALPRWQPIEKLLREYEADIERGREMCGILVDYGLLEPFTLQALPKEGGATNLAGMYRVQERKLEFLNAEQQRNLIRKGLMGRIYAHLISLENFVRLLDRRRPAARSVNSADRSAPGDSR